MFFHSRLNSDENLFQTVDRFRRCGHREKNMGGLHLFCTRRILDLAKALDDMVAKLGTYRFRNFSRIQSESDIFEFLDPSTASRVIAEETAICSRTDIFARNLSHFFKARSRIRILHLIINGHCILADFFFILGRRLDRKVCISKTDFVLRYKEAVRSSAC